MKTMARADDKAEIIRRLKMVRPDCARRWGRMSAHQMVCHLSDSFRLVTHQKAASPATRAPSNDAHQVDRPIRCHSGGRPE